MQLGLNLKVANLAARAGVENWNDLTTEQQQAIIVQEILNQTAATYGDIVDSAASRQAAFTAQLANTKLALGNLGATIWTAIMPVLTKLLAYLEVVFNYAAKVVSSILQLFGVKMNFTGGGALGQQPTNEAAKTAAKAPAVKEKTKEDTKEQEDTVKKVKEEEEKKSKNKNKLSTKGTDNAKKKNDKLSDSYNKVGDSAKNSAKKVKESSDTMQGALAGIDELNVLSFGSASADNSDDMIDAADSARDSIDDVLDDAMDATDDFGDIGTGISDAILDGLDAGLSTLPELALAPVDDVADAISGTLKKLFEPLKTAWDNMSPRLTKAIEAFKEQAKATFKELGNLLKSVWDNGKESAVVKSRKIGKTLNLIYIYIL